MYAGFKLENWKNNERLLLRARESIEGQNMVGEQKLPGNTVFVQK